MKKLQQLLCLLLCLVFCLALLPAASLAEDADEDTGAIALVEDPAGEGAIAPATESETLPAPGDEPNAGDVAINATNFPDAKFRAFVQQYDTDSSGSLNASELAAVTKISCGNQNIADLKGIEHFTALTWLGCYDNQLTSLDLSGNTALTTLWCDNNQLTSLDLSGNTALKTLWCDKNQLTELDVSNNTALTNLDCYGNQLTFLDLSAVPALKDAVENGTRDTSNSAYDWYSSSQGDLYVDKTVTIITDSGVAINAANFPDANFRAFVTQYDTDGNGYLSTAELAAVTKISCDNQNIADLTGIEHFTALTKLICYDNRLTSLDVSNNTELIWLYCGYNRLTSLDVSQNTALTELSCGGNQLTSLDVSQNTALSELFCQRNQLTSLDMSGNTALTTLSCHDNQLASLDVSNNTELTWLECYNNQLTSLDLRNPAMLYLYCYDNQLTSLDLSQNTALTELSCGGNQLTSLDVSNNTELTWLDCFNNQLTSLDLSAVPALKDAVENGTRNTSNSRYDWYSSSQGNLYVDKTVTIITDPADLGVAINPANFPDANFRAFVKQYDTDSNGYLSTAELAAVTSMSCSSKNIADLKGVEHFTALKSLNCGGNQLTELDVSHNTALTSLYCFNNQLTSLDLSNNTVLSVLYCYNNQLTSLNLSNNTVLSVLYCFDNQLTSLDVSHNTALTYLECYNNQLTSLDLSNNTSLKGLSCSNNQLTSLDLSNNSALEGLYCQENQLTSLDLSSNAALTYLDCNSNQLTELDVSNNTELTYLECDGNQLTFLDLSAVPALKDAVENGTRDTSNSAYDWYSSSQGTLIVDKTVILVTAGNPFADVPEGKYYYLPVLWAYYHDPQITGGISETEFGPGQTCTREQIVTFLWKAKGAPEPVTTENPFTDVKEGKWYYKPVLWAVENGITGGVGDGKFGVGQPCTREQAMTFLWKAMGAPEPLTDDNPFLDVPEGKWYYKAVLWAVENGITSGVDAQHFGVGKSCTRGQIVTFLYKALVG